MRAAPCVLPILKIFSKKFIFVIDISFGIPYNTSCCGNKEQRIGLSPNGKATDSDSVIFKVRILVAQLRALRLKCSFLLLRKIERGWARDICKFQAPTALASSL